MLNGTALAFDFGERRIGVAVGDTSVAISHPLLTIDTANKSERFATIGLLIGEWKPSQLIVGLPLYADDTEHRLTELARRFAKRLKGRFSLPVWLVDERYTSAIAASMLAEAGINGRRQKPMLDQVAAQSILYAWFDSPGEAV